MSNRQLVGSFCISAGSCVEHRELNQELCDTLEGRNGGCGEVQEEGGIGIFVADSHCCMAEANTIW